MVHDAPSDAVNEESTLSRRANPSSMVHRVAALREDHFLRRARRLLAIFWHLGLTTDKSEIRKQGLQPTQRESYREIWVAYKSFIYSYKQSFLISKLILNYNNNIEIYYSKFRQPVKSLLPYTAAT